MGIISKLKEKFLGKQDHAELAQALTVEKEQRAASDLELAGFVYHDERGIRYVLGSSELKNQHGVPVDSLQVVEEPPYRRSTTASRRAAQRKLDESRNKRPTYANRKMLRQVAAGHAPF